MVTLPAWNNQSEYSSLSSEELQKDMSEVESIKSSIEKRIVDLGLPENPIKDKNVLIQGLREISKLKTRGFILVSNFNTYASCEICTNSQNNEAIKAYAQFQNILSHFLSAVKPFELFLTCCEENLIQEYLNHPDTQSESFFWRESRRCKELLLTTKEEILLNDFKQFGLTSWGNLYSQIASSLQIQLPEKGSVGSATAMGYLFHHEESLRKMAWQGLQKSWFECRIPCAAILNNLSGFRTEEYKKRSHTRKIDFLDFPLMESKIERATLDTLMQTVENYIHVPRLALKTMAKCFGKDRIDPWDTLAPNPKLTQSKTYSFVEALQIIKQAFAQIDTEMADFVDLMVDQNWIEARVLPFKRGGAFCTKFHKSNTPRVFQTFLGSLGEVSTLAHELGHAYHDWVMRDLPLAQSYVPMTLAETASLFSENILADYLLTNGDEETRFGVQWKEANEAVTLMINIPSRFQFEKDFYTARKDGTLTPDELDAMTDKAWRKWYGDEISETEKQFWMTKLHFSISRLSFYNYPYLFGYLFSLGIYAKKGLLRSQFASTYKNLLRDTGRMTAEELVAKHFAVDISQPEFWTESIRLVEEKVNIFAKTVAEKS